MDSVLKRNAAMTEIVQMFDSDAPIEQVTVGLLTSIIEAVWMKS